MLLYYITDRSALGEIEAERRSNLLQKIAEAARAGVDYIQLREKDLSSRDLESLTCDAVNVIAQSNLLGAGNRQPRTRLLINSCTDVAIACSADGIHLRASDISPRTVREIYSRTTQSEAIISIACHTIEDVSRAAQEGANLALLAPVFGKLSQKNATVTPGIGLDALRAACKNKVPVLALGGVTLQSAQKCKEAGAAGIAAIRLFQENNIAEAVRQLRKILSS